MESLKAQREKYAREVCADAPSSLLKKAFEQECAKLRELQKQAIMAWEERRRQPDCAGDTIAIDELLDEVES